MSGSGSGSEAMDLTLHPPATVRVSDGDTNGKPLTRPAHPSSSEHAVSATSSSNAPPAAPAVHQPKIVHTAFIHKLYNMLEDSTIQHLISWTSNEDSFVVSPSADFSKVLSQYFKHTNISSFVRQLNMYGFHKERDVFHTGSPDTTLWEFKHGAGNFKRGDLMGLREIKRRASRHSLVHRESNYNKAPITQPGTPSEPAHMPSDNSDARLANLEHALYDMSARLQRTEEMAHAANSRSITVFESANRLFHYNQELLRIVTSFVSADSAAYRDAVALQGEVQRHIEGLRAVDESYEGAFGGRAQYLGVTDTAPVSPRQLPQDDSKRAGGLTVPQHRAQLQFRPAIAASMIKRPYGSIGGSSSTQSSSPLRNPAPPPPPGPHPLSNVDPPPENLPRRHTAADISAHGWQPAHSSYPPSNPPSAPWPSSPSRVAPEDQRIRDSLSSYSLLTASHSRSRPATPPPPPTLALPQMVNGSASNNGPDAFANWSWGSSATRDSKSLFARDTSAPPTRRGSMAHILNPSDTAERSDEDDESRADDGRKRQRMQ
ncbi:hypothetical protein CDD82_1609 [Ophiocordyceps australis]|uniref:HSF-type DNA-binding domain-containing protein n=1 Tax=Ophiocordyceps australis TaxID=1399860 RepID=A0A2C5ZU55_9HYPO|nr:hypothetical protein CDD82_1609 [Ophiocordyceps australis]